VAAKKTKQVPKKPKKRYIEKVTFLLLGRPRKGDDILGGRVARFSFVHGTKSGKNVPNEHKMYQVVIKYPKYL
jgi:hypothetical protein